MGRNAGWLFYRSYYDHLVNKKRELDDFVYHGKTSFKEQSSDKKGYFDIQNQAILELNAPAEWSSVMTDPDRGLKIGNCCFPMKTTYPGLIIGSGYSHATGAPGEFKLGFFFDHTTGLPCIPGSSVKGILRSAFPGRIKSDHGKSSRISFINKLLNEIRPELAAVDPLELEMHLFEGEHTNRMYGQDVFFDAFPMLEANEKLFSDDFITPHNENPLKDPVPVSFLKIRPGVKYSFNFRLSPVNLCGVEVKVDDKKELFRKIIGQFGAGAKTNVGYGQFTEC